MIVHLMHAEKFVAPFIEFLSEDIGRVSRHHFYILGNRTKYPVEKHPQVYWLPGKQDPIRLLSMVVSLIRKLNVADKIIIHGLFSNRYIQILTAQPWLLSKCYWVIWGGDLYAQIMRAPEKRDRTWRRRERLKAFIIKRLGHLVTYIDGDIELARQWYGAKGRYHQSLVYPSNLFEAMPDIPKMDSTLRILVGNSAAKTNNHFEVLSKLAHFCTEDMQVYVPLSYGNAQHREDVIAFGKEALGDKFMPVVDFMPLADYRRFLSSIDIAIFNHNRQQGMGSLISLLGMGKKIFMRTDISTWKFCEQIGAKVYDVNELELSTIDEAVAINNQNAVQSFCSPERLRDSLIQLFTKERETAF